MTDALARTAVGDTVVSRPSADFLLPGRWWHIDLDHPSGVSSQVRAMSRTVVGRQDDRAQLRHDIQVTVERAAVAARDARASDFYFAVEIVPGVPIPACLAVYWPDLPVVVEVGATLAATAEAVAEALRRSQPEAVIEDLGGEEIAVVRSVKTMVGPTFQATGVDGARELVASYWALRRGAPRPLLLSFTSALVSMRDEMIPLFDAIVGTVTWTEPDVP